MGLVALSSVAPVLRRCGWGVAVLDFPDVFAPSLVFGRGGGLPGAKQIVPRYEVYAEVQALSFACPQSREGG